MLKKVGNVGLILGGLAAAVGGILAFVMSKNVAVGGMIGMAVLSRIGAIVLFVSAIAVLADAFMTAGSKKGGAVTKMIFGLIAFVGQFFINPYTSMANMLKAAFSGNAQSAVNLAAVGFIAIAVSGIVLLIMGIKGVASKKKI